MQHLAPLLTNRAVMLRRAWEQTFDLEPFPEAWRGVIRSVAGLTTADGNLWGCGTEALIAAVQLTNGGKRTASETQIRETKEAGLIKETEHPTDRRFRAYRLAPGTAEKLIKINNLELKISIVIVEQSKAPDDPLAGSKYVPESIYFNFWDPDSVRWMRSRVAQIESENRLAKGH